MPCMMHTVKKAEAALVIEVEEEGEEDQDADRAAATTADDVCKRRTKDCQIAAEPDSSTRIKSSAKQEGIRTDVQQLMKQWPLIERMQRKLKQANDEVYHKAG
jgi:hypothetical protein